VPIHILLLLSSLSKLIILGISIRYIKMVVSVRYNHQIGAACLLLESADWSKCLI
jgi:hypothetical protein